MLNAIERRKIIRRIGLFQAWKEIFTRRSQVRQIEEITQALKKSLSDVQEAPNLTIALKYLEKSEEIFNRAKFLLSQIKERQKRLLQETDFSDQREELIAESQLEDIGGYISGVKLLVKIVVDGKTEEGIHEKMGYLISWFGFSSPQVESYITEEIVEEEKRKMITLKDTKCCFWDDLPANIRKRHLSIKRIFERVGGKFYYQASPSEGTKVTIILPNFKNNSHGLSLS